MTDSELRIQGIFAEARQLDRGERTIYLDRECAGDTGARARVESLLAAMDRADDIGFFVATTLDRPQASFDDKKIESHGRWIGPYKLLQHIGRGGFGDVWAAEQREPVRRRVAIKVIKAGMDSRQVLARFEAERQALAVMDHPGIAKFLDAGMTEEGRPFFAMEHVRGIPITEFCEQERMTLDDRVRLMIQVCHAVQHAHMKGVIHRDLKPSNILVELIDRKPVAKVIDFGVAKALAQPLTGNTIYTERGQMIGTPEYMSPEQARGSGVDIDTRADVYSLGAILYELLTGLTPFDSSSLRDKGYAELQRVIEREEAPRPSLRLSTIAKTPSGSGQSSLYSIDPAAMSKRLKGDMDWIAMKCLEKERGRRYDTPSALAADLERFLNDQPVEAGPPSVTYRAKKFIKRNRALVTGGVLVTVVLVLGIVGTTWGMIWALNEKERADTQTGVAVENANRAAEATERAERELARATEVKQLITDMLSGIDPGLAQGADTTILTGILEDTAARLDRGEVTDELVAAELRHIVGRVYLSLARPADALPHVAAALEIRKRLLGGDDIETLRSMHNLAIAQWSLNRFDEAEAIYRETLALSEDSLGADHWVTISALSNLANVLRHRRRFAESEQLHIETIERCRRVHGPEQFPTLEAMSNLASLYLDQFRYTEAEPLFVEVLGIQKRTTGPRHPGVLDVSRALAQVFVDQGRYAEAESMLVPLLDDHRLVFGDDHPLTQQTEVVLGQLYTNLRRFEQAEPLLRHAAETHERQFGMRHPWTLEAFSKLGRLSNAMEHYDDAKIALEAAAPTMRDFLGRRDPRTQSALSDLVVTYVHLGRSDEALPLVWELLEVQRTAVESPDAAAHTLNVAASTLLMPELGELREPARALALAERACEKEESEGGRILWKYLNTLALAQHLTGDTARAIETQRGAIRLAPDKEELRATLAEYEAALATDGHEKDAPGGSFK